MRVPYQTRRQYHVLCGVGSAESQRFGLLLVDQNRSDGRSSDYKMHKTVWLNFYIFHIYHYMYISCIGPSRNQDFLKSSLLFCTISLCQGACVPVCWFLLSLVMWFGEKAPECCPKLASVCLRHPRRDSQWYICSSGSSLGSIHYLCTGATKHHGPWCAKVAPPHIHHSECTTPLV